MPTIEEMEFNSPFLPQRLSQNKNETASFFVCKQLVHRTKSNLLISRSRLRSSPLTLRFSPVSHRFLLGIHRLFYGKREKDGENSKVKGANCKMIGEKRKRLRSNKHERTGIMPIRPGERYKRDRIKQEENESFLPTFIFRPLTPPGMLSYRTVSSNGLTVHDLMTGGKVLAILLFILLSRQHFFCILQVLP